MRAHAAQHLYDESAERAGAGIAIYTLADPRDVRSARYVGQSRAPRRRLLQHLTAARLWLPDETPWWIHAEKYRPLYTWIRTLHADGCRMPVMILHAWVEGAADARAAERELIRKHVHAGGTLLNVEAAAIGPQLALCLAE